MVQKQIAGLHIQGVTYRSAPCDRRMGDVKSVLCSMPFELNQAFMKTISNMFMCTVGCWRPFGKGQALKLTLAVWYNEQELKVHRQCQHSSEWC